MSKIVERVARALTASDECTWENVYEREPFPIFWTGALRTKDDYRNDARAAIAATSEPTPEMIAVGQEAIDEGKGAAYVWRIMNLEALK